MKINQAALKAIEAEATAKLAATMQPALDAIHTNYAGQPVAVIKPVLSRRRAAVAGGKLDEATLTNAAQAISDGTRVVFTRDGQIATR